MDEATLCLKFKNADSSILEEGLTVQGLFIRTIGNKESLIKNTQMAVDNGAFGVPTFFLHDDVFFGKEALREIPDFL